MGGMVMQQFCLQAASLVQSYCLYRAYVHVLLVSLWVYFGFLSHPKTWQCLDTVCLSIYLSSQKFFQKSQYIAVI